MRSRLVGLFAIVLLVLAAALTAPGQPAPRSVTTNRDRLLVIAVQGQVAAAQTRGYIVTWDGKPKLATGTGGINYNLRLGDRVFGWAGDRATVGVAAEAAAPGNAWLAHASIGNEVRVIGGAAQGEKGVVVGVFGSYALLQLPEETTEKLAVGDRLQIKAFGLGLEIDGFKDIFAHNLSPELFEKMGPRAAGGRLEVPVVKRIPAEIVGQGSGGGALAGHWHIQTCYPPDIKKYGLDELRFGDLVLLEDTQTDYGRGYYKGGATVGVVCGGPSDQSGLGIPVATVLSSRLGQLAGRIDPGANIGKYLGLPLSDKGGAAAAGAGVSAAAGAAVRKAPAVLKLNRDSLIVTAVEGVVQPTYAPSYSTTYDGKPWLTMGMASINYRVTLGDTVYGWAQGDHVEPDVTIQGRDRPSPSECALAVLACIGNEAEVLSGEAQGAKGYYIGRHAGSDDKVWFPKEAVEKLALGDRVRVKAKGLGLRIEGFEDVKLNKMSPELFDKLGLALEGGQIVVPVVMEVPGHIMGSGLGFQPVESLDYDIQTTCPEVVEQYGLKKLKLGDLVAIRDHSDVYSPGRHVGAVTIGTVIHGFSEMAGHGPGVNPIISAMPGRIKIKIDPNANIAYYLGIKPRPN
jgi:hypothetical protein